MTALGISLIVSGLTLVGASIVFLMFTGREPSSSQETFDESLTRLRLRPTRRVYCLSHSGRLGSLSNAYR